MKFADTGWWVAWSSSNDRRHEAAVLMAKRRSPGEQILTTNLVLGESWTFIRTKTFHAEAVKFLDRIGILVASNSLQIHRVSREQESAAWEFLRNRDERTYSFVDATSFRVMTDRRLREALAFDSDFAAAGFVEVQP
jgi:uncharacterized protein